MPVSTVSLVDRERVWFAGNTGSGRAWSPRVSSFSTHLVGGRPLIVPDSLAHPLFRAHGTGRDPVRFLAGAPVIDADGHVLGGFCVFDNRPRDFTRSQLAMLAGLAGQAAHHLRAIRAQHELDRARQREEDFVATISREMRTPITVMQGYLETLEDEDDLAPYRPMIDPIRRSGDRLVRMVDHLLAGTEPMAEPVTVEPGRIELECVARAALGSCLNQAAAAGVRLRLAADAAPVPVSGDFGALSRATEQLLRNAIAFARPDSEIVVRVIGTGGPAIEVADRGAGIPADELPHVTERFFRGRHARENAVPGVGLGLTIATRIAGAHGGSLTITSDGPGAGTTARLSLPPLRHRPEHCSLAPAGHRRGRGSAGPRSRTNRLARP